MGTWCCECYGRPLTLAALALAVLRLPIRGCCFTIPLRPLPRFGGSQGHPRRKAGGLPGCPAVGGHYPLAAGVGWRRRRSPRQSALGAPLPRGQSSAAHPGAASAGFSPALLARLCRDQGLGDRPPQGQQGGACAAASGASAGREPAGGAGRSRVSYRPVALFNAADLEGVALEVLIQKRRQAEGALVLPRSGAAGCCGGGAQQLADAGGCCLAKPDWDCCRGVGGSIRAAELWGFPPNSWVPRQNRPLFHKLNAQNPAAGGSSAAPAVEKPSPLDRRQRGALASPSGIASRQEGSSGLASHDKTRPYRTGFAALTPLRCP